MFCPICRSEYREGFTACAECEVALVNELPPEPEPEFHDFIEVMTVFDEGAIALIKSVFDDAGLIYYFHGEYSHRLVPLPFATRLMVREDDASEAKRILTELDLM
jgi:hypothetical protein